MATANNKSTDLSHRRVFKAGDRLDKLTDDIYQDSNLMLQVARFNGLTSLRNLRVGLDLAFPPLEKTAD